MIIRRATLILGALAAAIPGPLRADGHVSQAQGVVEIRRAKGSGWAPVRALEVISSGDRLRTGYGAAARLGLGDGSTLELGPDASLVYAEDAESGTLITLDMGRLKAQVARQAAGRFELRTPTARCRVRGTEFEVRVLAGGRTLVELREGLLGVEDNHGNQTLLRPNERLQIDVRGLEAPERRPSVAQVASADFKAAAMAEVGLEFTQDQFRAAAARELKLSEFQQGKTLIDVNGNRVRLEEYVVRPRADQFKLVILNQRESRMDYFYYLGTFNRALPADLSGALAQLQGCADRQCDWFLTEFVSARSNFADSLLERGVNTLGGQIDVNSNATADDNVARLFDSATDSYADVAGRSVFQTLFNRYGFYVNGKLKYGWLGDNIGSYADVAPTSAADPFTGAGLTGATAWLDPVTATLATRSVNVTYPTAGRTHQRIYESYSDGSFLQWDNYVIDDEGRVAGTGEFGAAADGIGFRRRVLDFNYEQVVTSSHFGGRKIDIVIEPKILAQAGLLESGLER